MKEFHFSKTYFNKLIFDDAASKIRVVIKETPSLEITEEDYSLRVETRHEDGRTIHRNYAIEHHLKYERHNYPHLQFKFYTEEIGTFRIRLFFNNSEEYKKAILGFIYKIKNVLEDLERYRKGITEDILILGEVNKLSKEGDFLVKKIGQSLDRYYIEFDELGKNYGQNKQLDKNLLLQNFLGGENIKKIIEVHKK